MPLFLAEIREWQQLLDVTPTVTALVGFSQGAIMSLEAGVTPGPPAGRVIAIAGRYARFPITHRRIPPFTSCTARRIP